MWTLGRWSSQEAPEQVGAPLAQEHSLRPEGGLRPDYNLRGGHQTGCFPKPHQQGAEKVEGERRQAGPQEPEVNPGRSCQERGGVGFTNHTASLWVQPQGLPGAHAAKTREEQYRLTLGGSEPGGVGALQVAAQEATPGDCSWRLGSKGSRDRPLWIQQAVGGCRKAH